MVDQKTIAEKAGVSRATVSRAFTQNANVSPRSLAKIQAAMESLGLQPLCFGADGTAGKGSRAISMKSLIERAHVYGDDIALLEDVSAGDPVDHHLVDRDARACREAV